MTSIINSILGFISPNSNTAQEVTIDDIKDAQTVISKACYRTPLIKVGGILQGIGPSFYLKCENLQAGGAFKLRGAYYMISKLSDKQKDAGIITYSSGNHGLSCSLASKMLGIKTCVVVMPTNAPNIKKDGVLRYGGEVQLHGTTTIERKQHAEQEME